ncbi:hypothetical protein B0T21DRAFT_384945 [Apiosordaria backusii]|uniref:Uncharacterized protein n=1 Tax=Apiosordaria backusii TaxID=314023 RepID=A0AA40BEF0_9PEZI|nr:hypothetical protein B0T21DRAFT_384945 [Apiosordaria backusii]
MCVVLKPPKAARLITHWRPSRRSKSSTRGGINRQRSLNLTVTPYLDPHHPLYKRLGPNSLSRYPFNLLTNYKMDTFSTRRSPSSSFTTSKLKPQTQVFTAPSATRLEIILLALGILSLISLLVLILALAVRRRVSTSIKKRHHHRSSQPDVHGRVSSPCLFNTAFSGPLPHEPLLSSSSSLPADDNVASTKTSLFNRVRKASEDLAEAVQYELMELGRKVSAHGRAVVGAVSTTRRGQQEQERRMRDEEVGLVPTAAASGAGGGNSQGHQRDGFDGWRDQDNRNWSWDPEAGTEAIKPETVMTRSISWALDRSRRSSYAYSQGLASPCDTGQVFRARVRGGNNRGERRGSLAVTGAEYAV